VRENIEDQLRDVQEALEESERNLAEVEASEVRVRLQLEELQIQSRSDREHDAAALKKAVSELSDGRKQIAVLKDTTAMGTKQAEVDTLIAERDELVRELSALQGDAESAALERDQLAERLIEFEHGIGAEVEGRVVAERESGLLLERRLRSAVENLAQANERQRIMESEKQLLAGEVDELNHWRAVYESGHGLQELARSQKKIKEDNRRLGIILNSIC
jgi:chromosome segregation ATPase